MTTKPTTETREGTAEFYRGHAAMFLSGLKDGTPAEAVEALAECLSAAFARGGEVAASRASPDEGRAREALRHLRLAGWMVASHNDYRLDGVLCTFWLFTHPSGRWVKEEGRVEDEAAVLAEALEKARAAGCSALLPSPPAPTTENEGRDMEDSDRVADRHCNKCGRVYTGVAKHDGCFYFAGVVHHHNAPAVSKEGERHG